MELLEALRQVPDPRGLQGRDHPLSALLGLVILAKLCGEKSLAGAQRFGRLLTTKQKRRLGFRKETPALSTITETLRIVDAQALGQVLAGIMLDGKAVDTLAIDGKTERGSASKDAPATHCVSAFCAKLAGVAGQVSSKGKGYEIPDALRLLKRLELKGVIITGDAMFCQTSIAGLIVEKGGDYVFPLKDNQPGLKEAVELALRDPELPKKTPQQTPKKTTAASKNAPSK